MPPIATAGIATLPHISVSCWGVILTAFVFVNGNLLSEAEAVQYGSIHWYKDGALIMDGAMPYEGFTLTILESDLVDKGVYEARLEG